MTADIPQLQIAPEALRVAPRLNITVVGTGVKIPSVQLAVVPQVKQAPVIPSSGSVDEQERVEIPPPVVVPPAVPPPRPRKPERN
jgi:hypothetical protein